MESRIRKLLYRYDFGLKKTIFDINVLLRSSRQWLVNFKIKTLINFLQCDTYKQFKVNLNSERYMTINFVVQDIVVFSLHLGLQRQEFYYINFDQDKVLKIMLMYIIRM